MSRDGDTGLLTVQVMVAETIRDDGTYPFSSDQGSQIELVSTSTVLG